MSVETHEMSIEVEDFMGACIPWCSCGWNGRRYVTPEDAEDEWDNHCDQVFMAATGG